MQVGCDIEQGQMSDPETFWRELPDVLAEAEQQADADAAETMINFLEDFRHVWPEIVKSMRLTSAAKRTLVERSVAVLAEREDRVDDGIPN
jgi:hypothetical protein